MKKGKAKPFVPGSSKAVAGSIDPSDVPEVVKIYLNTDITDDSLSVNRERLRPFDDNGNVNVGAALIFSLVELAREKTLRSVVCIYCNAFSYTTL